MADTACTEFAFVIPPGTVPGTVLKVPAPDGSCLHLPCPGNIKAGDKLFMAKGPQGNWDVSKAERKQPWRSSEQLARELADPSAVQLKLDTSKGPLFLKVVPSWAPIGVRRLLQLVDEAFFSDLAIYRALEGGLLQFGLVHSADPRFERHAALEDDQLVGIPFQEGTIAFAGAGSGSRKCALCIFLGDFREQLGYRQPETPLGSVEEGSLSGLRSLHTGYGELPQLGGTGPDPEKLEELGNGYIRENFPLCDFVLGASRA